MGETILMSEASVPMRVLMVDDEEAILFAFKKWLGRAGFVVDTAQDFDGAVDKLRTVSYQAVVADLRLTGADATEGFDIIKEARRTQKKCRVIVATAYGNEKTRETVFSLGADIYLEKPIPLQKLQEILHSL
jgi:DNA-binding response OmpR family regulator